MRLIPAALLLLLSVAWSCRACGEAAVEGVVALPKPKAVPVVNQRYQIVAQGNGVLAPYPPVAVVWLEGSFPAPTVPPTAEVTQKDLTFVPALLPVQVGTRVAFPNLDDTYHNIFSYSAAKRFDLGRYRPDERPVPTQVFDTPGMVTLRCDVHEHMRGLILVLATPYFVVTDSDGHFRLTGLPPGHFVLKAWLDSKTVHEQPVELVDGKTLSIDFP